MSRAGACRDLYLLEEFSAEVPSQGLDTGLCSSGNQEPWPVCGMGSSPRAEMQPLDTHKGMQKVPQSCHRATGSSLL